MNLKPLFVLLVLQSTIIYSQISFKCGFENGMIGNNAFKKFMPDPLAYPPQDGVEHRWKIDNTISRSGINSLRIELRPGDTSNNGSDRAELRGMIDSLGNHILETDTSGTKFYGLSVKIEENWKPPVNNFEGGHAIILQLHQIAEDDSLPPPGPAFALNCKDRFFIVINARELHEPKPDPYVFELMDGSLNPGKWVDFIIKIKYSIKNKGLIQIWRRNEGKKTYKEVFFKKGITTLLWDYRTNKPVKHTWHTGFYRNAQLKVENPVTNILWLDNYVRANSFQEAKTAYGLGTTKKVLKNNLIQLNNYPNPFNPITKITFTISEKDFIRITVYDMIGREVVKLAEREFEIGNYEIEFNAKELPSGVYVCNLVSSSQSLSKKVLLIK